MQGFVLTIMRIVAKMCHFRRKVDSKKISGTYSPPGNDFPVENFSFIFPHNKISIGNHLPKWAARTAGKITLLEAKL